MSRLDDFFETLPPGATVRWYHPYVCEPGFLPPIWCDLYLIVDDNSSFWAWTVVNAEMAADDADEAVEYGEEYEPPFDADLDNPSNSNWNMVFDYDSDGKWSVQRTNEALTKWCRVVKGRSDLTFEYIEDWDMKNDPEWAKVTEAFKNLSDNRDDYIQMSENVMVSPQVFDTLLEVDEATRTRLSEAISELGGIVEEDDDTPDM